jgi:hypothetical protein
MGAIYLYKRDSGASKLVTQAALASWVWLRVLSSNCNGYTSRSLYDALDTDMCSAIGGGAGITTLPFPSMRPDIL